MNRLQHALDVGRAARADDRHDHAVGRHLGLDLVAFEQELSGLVAADSAAAGVDHDAQRVQCHHARGREEAGGQLLEASGGAHAPAQRFGCVEGAIDSRLAVHGEAPARDVERQRQQRTRAGRLKRAERAVDQGLQSLAEPAMAELDATGPTGAFYDSEGPVSW
jgi:hypothetical protein